MSVEDLKKQIRYNEEKEKKNRAAVLPADYSLVLPDEAVEWLEKYQITEEERLTYRIGWTNDAPLPASPESLVLPAFDVFGTLLLCQFRSFRQDGGYQKYVTRGYPESVIWTVPNGVSAGRSLCVVEDFVSCLRVGRTVDCMPLWGSNLSLNQVRRLCDRYENLYLWLDFNKVGHAKKLAFKAQPYFKTVSVIATELDPKEYSDVLIAQNLGTLP